MEVVGPSEGEESAEEPVGFSVPGLEAAGWPELTLVGIEIAGVCSSIPGTVETVASVGSSLGSPPEVVPVPAEVGLVNSFVEDSVVPKT